MIHSMELIIVAASITAFVATLAMIPWLVRRLPADYLVRPPARTSLARMVARNALGVALVAAGIAMLVLPGQGIVTIILGLSVVDLPLKHRLLARLLRQPAIERGVQVLRRRAGKPPLVIPGA